MREPRVGLLMSRIENSAKTIPAVKSSEDVKLTTLGNRIRVVTETMDHVATAACGIWVGAGARHEREIGRAHV